MGLFDVLTGMPGAARGRSGMSPIAMAALGLLAYKAIKGNSAPQPTQQSQQPEATAQQGGFGNILQSLGLGPLATGAATGANGGLSGVLSGGLSDLVSQFEGAGKGDLAHNWVSTEPNKPIPPADLAKILTPARIEFLTQKTGLSRDELLAGLSQQLPEVVDKLTPGGRIPSPQELDRA
jgi:uncharacterized protein YidB (DUF937 family)